MRKLEMEDFSKIVHVSNPQLSPNEKFLSFVVVRPNLKENKYSYEIWVKNLINGETRAVTSGNEIDYGQVWYDDNSLIFVSRRGFKEDEKGNALYYWPLGGEPRLIAKIDKGAGSVKVTKSGLIAFLSSWVDGETDDDYVEIHDLPVWRDGSGFTDRHYSHLFVMDLNSGLYKQLTKGRFNVIGIEAANNSDKIALSVATDWRDPLKTEVWVIDPKKPDDVQKIVEGNYNFYPVWSPDDKYLILHGFKTEKGLIAHLDIWIVPSDGSDKPVNLTESFPLNTTPSISSDVKGPYRTYTPPKMTEDGWIYFMVNNAGRGNIYRVNLEGKIEEVIGGKQLIYEFNVGHITNRLVYVKVTPRSLPDIYVYVDGEEKRLTCFNCWLEEEIDIVEPKELTFRASDGVEIDGWYIIPKETNGKVPGVLFIHGGPKGAYGYAINFLHQLLVANGYAVMYCNPRGSDGYTEEFADIRGHYGERDYKDIMEFVDKVLEVENRIDPEKLAVTGISYGGYMTNWIITQTNRFKAAISENGIADWISDFYTSDVGYWFDVDQIGGTPWENIETYKRQSPVWFLDKVETPLLVIHSMNDYRCYIEQALMMHVGLKFRGKESRLVVFKKGSHGHSVLEKPKHRLKRYKLILRYLDEKLKGKSGKDD